jgi:GNAT superfamily N-acetyltransferase
MDTDVRIESLTEADVSALVALAREIWLAHYPAIIGMAQIEYMLAQRYSPATVLQELQAERLWWDKLLVGGVMAGFSSYLLEPAWGMKIDKLYVHPRHQRRGFGGLMIERAGQVARQSGCKHLALAVNKRNRTAIDAYLKHGFRIAEATVKDIGGGFTMDDFVMVRPTEEVAS